MTIKLADRMSRVKPSPTLALVAAAAALQKEGKDVIALNVGELDGDAPAQAIEGVRQALTTGQNKYTPVAGMLSLRQQIAAKFAAMGLTYNPATEIVVAPGGKPVIFNALLATVQAGDEVIIPTPYWVSYPDMVQVAEGTPVLVEGKEANGFKITPAQLQAAITPKTKWLILNSPSNPTGAVYSKAELEALGDLLLQHTHVNVIEDIIYEKLVYSGEFYSLAQLRPALRDRVLIIDGASKFLAMTGWRIGWGCAPAPLIKAMVDLQGHSTSNASSIAQCGVLEALTVFNSNPEALQTWTNQVKSALAEKRALAVSRLNTIPGFKVAEPAGAFYLYVNCSHYIGTTSPAGMTINSDDDFAKALLQEQYVAVVPGSGFGMSPYVRLSFATSVETLAKAFDRLASFCQGCQGKKASAA